MTYRTALSIQRDMKRLATLRVEGLVQESNGQGRKTYGISAIDLKTGVPFVVWTADQWYERREDAEIDWSNLS